MNKIDDRSISGNSFDPASFQVEPRGARWYVFNGNGNQIHDASTEEAARKWVGDRKAEFDAATK